MRKIKIKQKDSVGKWKLTSFPSCPNLVISHDSYIYNHSRGVGFGNYRNSDRIRLARILEGDCMICTVSSDNKIQKKILIHNKWKKIHTFYGKVQDKEIEIWINDI